MKVESNSYKLIPSDKIISDMILEIKRSKEKIYIQAMIIEFSKPQYELIKEIKNALKRGVKVDIVMDYKSFITTDNRPHSKKFKETELEKKIKWEKYKLENERLIDDLRDNGANVQYVNIFDSILLKSFPWFGRNHIKAIFIDDTLYIGGMNFFYFSFQNLDFMFKTQDVRLISTLEGMLKEVNSNNLKIDVVTEIHSNMKLMIDSGKFARSDIYKEAIAIIKSAKKSIHYVSQMLPNFELLMELKRAKKRGVDIKILNTKIDFFGDEDKFISRVDQVFFDAISAGDINVKKYEHAFVHAKVIVIDDKIAMFGSHNYTMAGVLMATNELAIETSNKEIVDQLIDWFKRAYGK